MSNTSKASVGKKDQSNDRHSKMRDACHGVSTGSGSDRVCAPHPPATAGGTDTQLDSPSWSAIHLVLAFLLFAFAFLSVGCRQDMQDQPKYEPLEPSTFFEDGRASRPLVEGTVARGQLREDLLFYTGKMGLGQQSTIGAQPANGQQQVPVAAQQPAGINQQSQPTGQGFTTLFPFPITKEVIDRGEERYNIYCSVCHDRTGTGLGMVVRRGYRQPPSFHIDRLREAPAGYFFDVITNGFGAMPDYSIQISPRDRWAIVAYIRALQLSQRGAIADVPPEEQQKLKQGAQQQGTQPGGHQ